LKCARLGLAGLLALCGTAAFAQWNFSTCAATGADGPDQAACNTAYGSTNLAGNVSVAAGIQSWTVPTTGTYRITAVGGRGAAGDEGREGGRGAELSGDFTLTAGATLRIAVGQQGQRGSYVGGGDGSGGGGGGSFVVNSANSPLLVAGGGGGARHDADQNGCDASLTAYGIEGSGYSETSPCTVRTNRLGEGGLMSEDSYGAGGAGFTSNGQDDLTTDDGTYFWGTGGRSWANGLGGGQPVFDPEECGAGATGGFGGGGSGNGCDGGGGGGGYSGGDGGWIAGGGGSYNTGANPADALLTGTGDGRVVITLLSAAPVASPTAVPTTSSAALVALALLLGVAGLRRARRR